MLALLLVVFRYKFGLRIAIRTAMLRLAFYKLDSFLSVPLAPLLLMVHFKVIFLMVGENGALIHSFCVDILYGCFEEVYTIVIFEAEDDMIEE